MLRWILALSCAAAAMAADRAAELGRLRPEQFTVKDAAVAIDRNGAVLHITFRYARNGEPEVRIPPRALEWLRDWRAWRGLSFEFQATSREPFQVGFFEGSNRKAMIVERLAGLRMRGAMPFDAFVQTRTRTPLLPLGYKAWPQRLFTFERVDEISFRMRAPSQDSQLTIYSLALSAAEPKDDILDRRPVIDRYGQWIPENWPGKAHSDEDLRAAWDQDRLAGARYPLLPAGGDPSQSRRATGFFRTERMDGRWVLVDPHGHPFFSAGMELVGYRQGSFATRVTGREFLYEQLPPAGPAWLTPKKDVSFYVANIMKRFGEGWEAKWRDHILARLRDWGFNTIANWSDRDVAIVSGIPYVLPLSGWTTRKTFPFPWDFPDVFGEEFERNAEEAARRQCAPEGRRQPDRMVRGQRASLGAQLLVAEALGRHAAGGSGAVGYQGRTRTTLGRRPGERGAHQGPVGFRLPIPFFLSELTPLSPPWRRVFQMQKTHPPCCYPDCVGLECKRS